MSTQPDTSSAHTMPDTTSVPMMADGHPNDRSHTQAEQHGGTTTAIAVTTLVGIAGSTSNFINCILGSGIVVLPYALAHCGWFLGLVVLVSVAALTSESCVLVVASGQMARQSSLPGLCGAVLGKSGELCCSVFMFLFTLGGLVTYMVIIGDTVPQVMGSLFHTASSHLQDHAGLATFGEHAYLIMDFEANERTHLKY
jgi:amino acid permease